MKSAGQLNYEAWCHALSWRNPNQEPLGEWESLEKYSREAWEAGAQAVLQDALGRELALRYPRRDREGEALSSDKSARG